MLTRILAMSNRTLMVALLLPGLLALADPTAATEEVQISPNSPVGDRHAPAIAFDSLHGEYLVVWHNQWAGGGRDIYGQRISRNGTLVGSWFCIACGPSGSQRYEPAVAYNPVRDEYLVVWTYEVDGLPQIWGKVIPWNGPGSSSELALGDWPGTRHQNPRVAYSSLHDDYLVVWGTQDAGGLPVGIGFRRVSGAGATGADGTVTTGAQAQQPALTYNPTTDEYLVVWREQDTVTLLWQIAGRRVRWDGIAQGSKIVVSATADPPQLPAVTSNEDDSYFVVWEVDGVDSQIAGQLLDAAGNLVGTPYTFGQPGSDAVRPAVAAARKTGCELYYYVTYQKTNASGNQAVYQVTIGSCGWYILFTDYPVSDYAFYDCTAPAVTSGLLDFFTVYAGEAPGDPTDYQQIYGRSVYLLFADGFERGSLTEWSSSSP